MKNILQYIVLLSCVVLGSIDKIQAQQVTNPATNLPVATDTTTQPRVAYPGSTALFGPTKYNYVRDQIPDIPSTTWPPPNNRYRQTTEYLDGLGRSMQTVAKNAHADSFDIVSQKVYDDGTGRETYTYLPFIVNTLLSDGYLETAPFSRMRNNYDAAGYDEQPYSKTETEKSPVGRLNKQLSPGRSWVGSNRGKVYDYWCNIAAEGVRIFTIGNNPGDVPVTNATYMPFVLYVDQVTDEDGKYSLEYKDKSGLTILKKTRVSGTSPAHDGFACTYFVYDDLQRLRYIIPPKAVAAISATWNVATVADLCFSYFYDAKGNTIEKKIPGKAKEEFVYDKRDRIVFQRDGNLAANAKWAFTIYDVFDRVICTGVCLSSETRITVQGYLDDNTVYQAPNLLYYQKNYGLCSVYPQQLTNAEPLTYTFYDDYTSAPNSELLQYPFDPAQFSNITLPADGTVVPSVLSNHTKGLVTGNKIKVIDPEAPGADQWLTSVNYYDDKGKVIQSQLRNHRRGIEISSNIYYFQGMLWKNILRHENPDARPIAGTTDGAHTNYRFYTTNTLNLHLGGGNDEIKSITQKIDTGIEYQLSNYYYDHLGRMVVKQTPAANFLNEYTIRGFLNHIQVANPNNLNDTVQLFDEKLYYDKGFASKLYNGNIAGITWRKAGNLAPIEAYGYSYDPLDRLTHAEYRRKNTQNNWVKTAYDYTASNITYDLNGNILSMNQRGINPPSINTPINMDQLTYNYAPNSNQLIKVVDGVSASSTQSLPDFKDNPNVNLSQEYSYDPNGNLIQDQNKGLSSINYSYINKPEAINVDFKGKITYIYDALGNKLQKRVQDKNTNVTDTFDYLGNFVYKNDTLQYVQNGEGRCRPVANPLGLTKFIYDYFVKDHLGNVRSTVAAQPITADYLARHEIGTANVEQLVFDNIPNVRDAKPVDGKPGDNMAARLDGGDPSRRVGTAIMLQVMPGDRFTISADAYYQGDYQQSDVAGSQAVIESLMGALLNGQTYAGVPLSELPANVKTVTTALNNTALAGQLENLTQSTNDNNAPRAHLNVLFFNDKLELVPGGSSITQVPAVPQGSALSGFMPLVPNAQNQFGLGTQQVCCTSPGPGYVIVYVDNQSIGKEVWFDNIMIEHYTGKVQEENHYYPFGLTVQTDLAANAKKNDFKFQSQRHEDDFGLNMYSFKWRDHDPQTGRFWQIDPLAEKYVHNSTYAFSENKVVAHVELEGLESMSINPSATLWRSAGISSSSDATEFTKNVGKEALKPSTWGAAATVVGQAVIGPLLLGFMTEGALSGTAATSEVNAVRSVRTAAPSNVALASELEGTSTGASGKIEVTEASIRGALKGSDMKTTQGNVSLPMIKRYVEMLEAGSTAPPIKVAEGNVIIDGNHRYVAGKVAGVDPKTVKGTMSPSQAARVVPISDTKIDLADWGGY